MLHSKTIITQNFWLKEARPWNQLLDPSVNYSTPQGHQRTSALQWATPLRQTMATVKLADMTDEFTKEGMKALQSDLEFLFTDRLIPQAVQATIAYDGYVSLNTFRHVAKDEEDLRKWIYGALGIDPMAGREHRLNTAKIVDAWEATRKRAAAQDDAEAEQRASKQPRTLLKGTHVELRKKYELIHGEIDDDEYPSEAYIDSMLDELEIGRLTAESLCDVVAVSEVKDEGPNSAEISMNGKWRMKCKKDQVPMPNSPEELRKRYRIMARKNAIVALKLPGRTALKDHHEEFWAGQASWLLGKSVAGQTHESCDGGKIAPTWQVVLNFELVNRQKAVNKANMKGESLVAALMDLRSNDQLMQKHLTTPTAATAATNAVAALAAQLRGTPSTQLALAHAPPTSPRCHPVGAGCRCPPCSRQPCGGLAGMERLDGSRKGQGRQGEERKGQGQGWQGWQGQGW